MKPTTDIQNRRKEWAIDGARAWDEYLAAPALAAAKTARLRQERLEKAAADKVAAEKIASEKIASKKTASEQAASKPVHPKGALKSKAGAKNTAAIPRKTKLMARKKSAS